MSYEAVINIPVQYRLFSYPNWYIADDVRYMTATVYGEARGESIEGQIAVAYVIRNRAVERKQSVKDVVLAPLQFSCWNPYDPNRPILERILEDWDASFLKTRILRQCWLVSTGVLCGLLRDYSNGATHYLTKRLFYSDSCPEWAHKLDIKACIGRHIFLA